MPNACWFDGWLGKDPTEVPADETKSGKRYCYFSVGHNRSRKFPVDWIPCVAYGERARIILEDLRLVSGDYVIAQGELMSYYQITEGKGKKSRLQVRINKIHRVLHSKSSAESQYEDEPDQVDRMGGDIL